MWLADLILFWASKWVMLSVLTPSMATTRSPWFICDCAALLPGVICVGKGKKSHIRVSHSVRKALTENSTRFLMRNRCSNKYSNRYNISCTCYCMGGTTKFAEIKLKVNSHFRTTSTCYYFHFERLSPMQWFPYHILSPPQGNNNYYLYWITI